jgi:hypothetical protein
MGRETSQHPQLREPPKRTRHQEQAVVPHQRGRPRWAGISLPRRSLALELKANASHKSLAGRADITASSVKCDTPLSRMRTRMMASSIISCLRKGRRDHLHHNAGFKICLGCLRQNYLSLPRAVDARQ